MSDAMGSIWIQLVVAVLVAQERPLSLDESRAGRLVVDEKERGVVSFEFTPTSDGSFTVDVESLEFDARVRVRAPDGTTVADDDNSGAGLNARARFDGHAGERRDILVWSGAGGGGEFLVTLRASGPAASSADPPEQAEAETAWFEHAGQRAILAQKFDWGMQLLRRAGGLRYYSGAFDAARADFLLLLSNARARGARLFERTALAFLGAIDKAAGDFVAAKSSLIDAVTLRDGEAAEPSIDSFALDALGDVQHLLHEDESALATFERLAAVAERAPTDVRALILSKRGRELRDLSRIDEARSAHQQAIELIESGPANPYYECQVRGLFAVFLDETGEFERARATFDEALEAAPDDSAWDVRIDLLGNSCNTLLALGRLADARTRVAELESLAALHAGPIQAAQVDLTAATVELRSGDTNAARAHATDAAERLRGPGQTELRIAALSILAVAQCDAEDFTAASGTLDEAERSCVAYGDGAADALRKIRIDQSCVASAQGDLDRAERCASVARDSAVKANHETDIATSDASLAWIAFLRGKLDAADGLADSAAAVFDRLEITERRLDVLDTRAHVALARGDLERAAALVEAATNLVDQQQVRALDSLSAALVRSRSSRFGELALDVAIARAQRMKEGERDWSGALRAAARWKGRALLEGLEASGADAARPQDAIAADSVGRSLAPRQALVELAEGSSEIFALIVTPDSVRAVTLGDKRSLHSACDAYAQAISDRAGAGTLKSLGTTVGRRFAPLFAALDAGVEDLVVVPTPRLAQFPIDAIVLEAPTRAESGASAPSSELEFALDHYCVTCLPASEVLAELRSRAARTQPPRTLLLGDPICSAETMRSIRATLRGPAGSAGELPRLDGSCRELVAIARHALLSDDDPKDARTFAELAGLEVERDGARSARTFDIHLGRSCSRATVAGDLTRYSILHFATHGLVDPVEPRRTGLVLSDDRPGDGILTLEHVTRLRLDADLVVLSACGTACGPVVRGEGVESLAWAFLRAGSRSVVATLWRVDDELTATTMTRFYDHMLRGRMSPCEALCAAKREQRKNAARGVAMPSGTRALDRSDDPWSWAPFVFLGAPSAR